MAGEAVLYVRLRPSLVLTEFTAAALDLLVEVEYADKALVTDGVAEKALALREVIESWKGEL